MKNGIIICSLAAAMFIPFVYFYEQWENAPPTPPHVPTILERWHDQQLHEASLGALQLRSSMRNPRSFEVSNVIAMNSGAICYQYRAQNGFGGMEVGYAVHDGATFRTDTEVGFDRTWKQRCLGKEGEDITADVANIVVTATLAGS